MRNRRLEENLIPVCVCMSEELGWLCMREKEKRGRELEREIRSGGRHIELCVYLRKKERGWVGGRGDCPMVGVRLEPVILSLG